MADLEANYDGADLRIMHTSRSGTITVTDDGSDSSSADRYQVDEFAFADGTVLTRQEFMAEVLGTDGDDVFNGSGESDTFRADFNEGNDSIESYSSNYGETDTLIFADGIALGDITSTRSDVDGDGVDDLLITHATLGGSISVMSAYSSSSSAHRYAVDEFVFDDGTTLTQAEFIAATDDPFGL